MYGGLWDTTVLQHTIHHHTALQIIITSANNMLFIVSRQHVRVNQPEG